MSKSAIEWTTYTWNPIIGCNKVSQGCQNCYALTMSARIANSSRARREQGDTPTELQRAYEKTVKWSEEKEQYEPKWTGNMVPIPERLDDPYNYEPGGRVFVDSMTDIFHPNVVDGYLIKMFEVMCECRHLTFQILTKRPERMKEFSEDEYVFESIINALKYTRHNVGKNEDRRKAAEHSLAQLEEGVWPEHIWWGTSVEDQDAADNRIYHLLNLNSTQLFLSMEPLLGPVDIEEALYVSDPEKQMKKEDPMAAAMLRSGIADGSADAERRIKWVIVGGESGHNARPMHPDWARNIRDACLRNDVAYFFKQFGAWRPMKGSGASDPTPVGYWSKDPGIWRDYNDSIIYWSEHNGQDMAFVKGGITSNSEAQHMVRLGKKKSGNVLDGEKHQEFPNQMDIAHGQSKENS